MAMAARSLSRNVFTTALKHAKVQGGSATAGHAGGMKLWRNLSFFVALPAVGICMVNAYIGITSSPHEAPEFVAYEHMRIRTKKFPWGDGQRSLFHNPHLNALPDGYEHTEH